jgi:hypothetical protein
VSCTPGGTRTVYVPGEDTRWVANGDHSSPEPRGYIPDYGIRSHRVTIDPPVDWLGRGLLAVIAVGALALIADGGTLLLIAWLTR